MRFAKKASGFTLVELLVAILIFSFGFASVYILVDSSGRLSTNGKNMLTASQLAREQIELVKNLRDTNWIQLKYWDSLQDARRADDITTPERFASGFYLIENRTEPTGVLIKQLPLSFSGGNEMAYSLATGTRLCVDIQGRYTHSCANTGVKRTTFSSFLQVSPLTTKNAVDGNVEVGKAWKIISHVIWFDRGFHEVVLPFILTDWKK